MDIVVCLLLVVGLFFFTGGAVGILRFPDFYSRLHPAGKLDTLGSLLAMIALALFNLHHFSLGALLTSLKIMLILVFVFLASPTATHAIVDAGVRAGLAPWTKGEERR
ncbi:MAG: monovalent cation/H(+) antiporter subunit G [Thermodesulfobacteriota bacterium]|nr:monovalent cation/H(+) antiporter subunit G [Thermodesulfobacteriota bacterium]